MRRTYLYVVALCLLVIGAVVGAGHLKEMKQPDDSSVLAVFHTSRSTNSVANDITVNIDGSGKIACAITTDNVLGLPCANKSVAAGVLPAATLKATLESIGDVSTIPIAQCPKSVSFGTTTTVEYMGKTSGDISCADTTNHLGVVLQSEFETIQGVLKK